MRGVDQPNSPVSRSFRLHAGGIQPSASFFRPLRPTTPPDDVPLTSFESSQDRDHHRERDHSHEGLGVGEESPSPFQQTFSLRRTVKPSKEPLLPLPATASSTTRHGGPKASFDSSSQQQHTSTRTTRRNTTNTTSTFDPHPPSKTPPLSAIPLLHPSGKPIRKYESHPSHNRFFLGGRILTGGDTPYAFLITVLLALFLSSLWFGTTGVWWWRNEGSGGKVLVALAIYLSGITLTCLGRAAGMDPGILPRGLDEKPPVGGEGGGVPMPRDLRVRGDVARVKYCQTCKIYRPPRASHCKMCDNCVDGCDHHCQWINNCVGRRNYTTFFVLLVSATIMLVLFIVSCALHLYLASSRGHGLRETLKGSKGIGSGIVFCLSVCVVWPVAALLVYHMRLLLLNITTIEQIRNTAHKSLEPSAPPPLNPFSHGSWRRNCLAVLCRPEGISWLDARGVKTKDDRLVNPGLGMREGEEEEEEEMEEGRYGVVLRGGDGDEESVDRGEWKELVFRKSSVDGHGRDSRDLEMTRGRVSISGERR